MTDNMYRFRKGLRCVLLISSLLLPSCAYLYQAQVSDIDDRRGYERIPFEVKVSETGINVDEAAQIGGAIIGKQKESEELADIILLFQMGPRTGNPVYNERYAEDILERLRQKCPDGKVSSLTSVREMRKYPAISGEIIKIKGVCLRKRSLK